MKHVSRFREVKSVATNRHDSRCPEGRPESIKRYHVRVSGGGWSFSVLSANYILHDVAGIRFWYGARSC